MSITNATIAQQISDLIGYWDGFNTEYRDWLGGSTVGGPNSDGQYPLTDFQGATDLVDSPAKLADSVSSNVSGALAHKVAAEAAQTAAEAAKTSAETAETNAGTASAGSVVAKDIAVAAQLAAESARSTAIAQASSALASAVAAALSETNAATSETNAATSETNAAASAVAAATFDPALYAALADNEAVTGIYTHPNGLKVGSNNLLIEGNLWSVKVPQLEVSGVGSYGAAADGATTLNISNVGGTRRAISIAMAAAQTAENIRIKTNGGVTIFSLLADGGIESAADITATGAVTGSNLNVTNWDTAYGWGDHSGLYLGISATAANSALLTGLGVKGDGIPSGQQIIRSNSNGYTYLGWLNTTSGSNVVDPTRIYTNGGGTDAFLRYMTPANFIDFLEGEDWNFQLNTTFKAGVHADNGIHGGYVSDGTTFGATIFGIGASFDGGLAGSNSSSSTVYGLRWLRSTHPNAQSGVGEGLYSMVNGVTHAAFGLSGAILKGANGLYFNDMNTRLDEGTGNGLRVTTNGGYMDFGPQNSSWCHIYTDRQAFYTNKPIRILGGGATYHVSSGYAGGKITVAASAPGSPTKGDIWFDTT